MLQVPLCYVDLDSLYFVLSSGCNLYRVAALSSYFYFYIFRGVLFFSKDFVCSFLQFAAAIFLRFAQGRSCNFLVCTCCSFFSASSSFFVFPTPLLVPPSGLRKEKKQTVRPRHLHPPSCLGAMGRNPRKYTTIFLSISPLPSPSRSPPPP